MRKSLVIIIIPIILTAQNEPVKELNAPFDLSKNNKITTIATDSAGLNWIGTLEGLVCYNGERWHKITTKNSSKK